ncbi:MAG: hypothetical protein K1X75_09745 [Leptospirales bacterium]|nr:hypothetical protein [Leptospirales bacterium]
MAANLEQSLGKFNQDDLTVKICGTIFNTLPGGPPYQFYNTLDGAVQRVGGDLEKTRALAAADDGSKALWVAEALDTSDKLIAGLTGVKNLLSLFGSAPRKRTFEADDTQAADAALKGVGLAYMIYRLFPGDVAQKLSLFKELPAGVEIATYYVAADVALPFADNLAEAGAGLFKKLMNSQNASIASKFSAFAGGDALGQATSVFGQLSEQLEQYAVVAKGHVQPLLQKVQSVLPSGATMMNVADSATGVAATGLDVLPVYEFLGARLVAEACAMRSARGI